MHLSGVEAREPYTKKEIQSYVDGLRIAIWLIDEGITDSEELKKRLLDIIERELIT